MPGSTHRTTDDLAADRAFAERVIHADAEAEDALAALLRPMLDRIAGDVLDPAIAAETPVSALFEILQAEERILSAWSRETPLRVYLAVVAARVSLYEEERWRRLRGEVADLSDSEEHPGDDALARTLMATPPRGATSEPSHDPERCARCARICQIARVALGEPGGRDRGDDG